MSKDKEYEGRIILSELGEHFAPKATKPVPIKPFKQRKRKRQDVKAFMGSIGDMAEQDAIGA